jgi:hypothetical protein
MVRRLSAVAASGWRFRFRLTAKLMPSAPLTRASSLSGSACGPAPAALLSYTVTMARRRFMAGT